MRFPLPRATSTVRNPLDVAMYKRVVGTFNRSRWVSGSAGVESGGPWRPRRHGPRDSHERDQCGLRAMEQSTTLAFSFSRVPVIPA